MVCNKQATMSAITAIDKKIAEMHMKTTKAPDPAVYAPDVRVLMAEVDSHLKEAVAHGGDHDAQWIDDGMPGEGPDYDAWQTSRDITAGWQRRRDALEEIEKRCTRPKPRDPDGATTTPHEALAVMGSAEKAQNSQPR